MIRRALALALVLFLPLLGRADEAAAPESIAFPQGGVGLVLSAKPDLLGKVLKTLPDSPAAAAGIEEGDTIVQVDGKAVTDLNPDHPGRDLVDALGGPPGTKVEIVVLHNGKTRTVIVERVERSSFFKALASPLPVPPVP